MEDVQCNKLGSLVVLEDGNLDLGISKTSFVDDKQHLESVLGQTRESWFEEFTINKIQIRKCEDVKETLSVMNSPSCSPTISQLIYGQLTVGASPLRHSSPAPYCKDDSFIGRFNFETPQSLGRWNRPSVGRSPCPSPIVQNVLGISGLHGRFGADDSTLSWTSSLATPPRDTSVTSMDGEEDCLAPRTKETARALFSPGSGLDSTNESIQPLDSTVEEMQSDGENNYNVESNQSNVEIGCDKPTAENLEVNTVSCEMVCLDVGNVKQSENNSQENFKKRQIKRNEFSTEKTRKLKHESNFSSGDMKDNDMQQVVVGNTVNENSCDKNVRVPISSPTFSQKVKCRKFCVRNTQLLTSSPEVNSPVSDVLSDFFDPPSSSLRRRRPAPSCKRKSLEMEEGSFCVTPKLAFHESQILYSPITPEVNLKSILSSDVKKKDSSNKKVRFSKSVQKCSYIPEQGSNARAPKSINKSRRRKSLIKSSNLKVEDVTVKEKYNCIHSNHAKNRSNAITLGNEQNEETKEKLKTETMSRESDYSCHGENKNLGRSNDLGIGQLPNGSKTISKESNIVDRCKNIGKSVKVIANGCQQISAGRNKSNEVDVVDNVKNVSGVVQSLENESPKDELFSQVSPTCLNEMCSVAEHSVIHENNNDSIMSPTVKDERTPPMKGIINSERKTGKLLGRKKFFYPSISINSVSNSSKVFQFQEGHTDSKNKKKLLQSVSSKDMMVTMVTEKGDTNTETLNFTSDVERCKVVSDCVNVPETKVNEKTVKLVEMKLVSNEQNNRMLKRNANMSVSSRGDCEPELLDVAEPGKPIIGFHCASGKSLNISSTALDKAKTLLDDNVDYRTETNIKSPSYKTKCVTDIDRKLLDTSRVKNTVYNDSNLIATRYSELSLSKTGKEADGANKTLEEQANCVLNAVPRFQSASGKTCHISSSALKKAETLIEDDKSLQQPKTKCSSLPENKIVVMDTESVSAVQKELQGSFTDGITPYVVANEEYEFSEWPDEDMDPNDDILFTSDVLEHDISKNGKEMDTEDSDKIVKSEDMDPNDDILFTSDVLEHDISKKGKEIDTEDSDRIVKNDLKLLKSDGEKNNESDDNILHIKETCDLNSEIGSVCSYSDSKEAVRLREETNLLCQGRVVTNAKPCYELKQKFVGFQMASGKTFSIPDDKLKQAESMFDAENEEKNVDMAYVENKSKSSQKILGFHMASGKNINITEEKLKQTENLFETENEKEKFDKQVNQNEVSKTFECRQMSGFQMASGKAIEITDENLKRAEAVLDAENDGHSKFDIANCQDVVMNKIINKGISASCCKESDVCSSERDFLKERDVGDRQTSNSSLTKYKHPEIRKEVNYSINVSSASLDSKLNSETNNIILKSLFENELKQDVHSMENELDMLGELKSKVLNQRGEILSKSKSPCVTNLNRSSNDGKIGHPACRRSLPQGFRPFKAPKIVTKPNVIENKDLKLNITELKGGNENTTVKPVDSVTVNHGMKCDKTEQLPKVSAETPNTQGRKSTNVKVQENINNKLIGGDVCSPVVSAVISESDNNQLHSRNKDDFSIGPSENLTEIQKSSMIDRNDNDLFQGLSQFFEDEMELEENNVQYGETDDIAANLNDNSTKINSNEKSSNCTQNVDLTEEASPNSKLNNQGENECTNAADVENSVTQQQKLSCNVSENIKMQETNMNDSGFGTGSSNISKLTESSLFQSDVTLDVTFDQMIANDSAAENFSRMDKCEIGTLSESNQPPTSFCGFKTASGIEKMSDSALRRGRKTLTDADNMNDAHIAPELNIEAERYFKDSDKEELNRSGDITLTENGMFGSQKVTVCDRNAAGNVVLEKGVKSALCQAKHSYCDSVFTENISPVPSFHTAPGMPAKVHVTVLENAKLEKLKVSDNVQSVSSFRAPPPKTSTCTEETIKTGEPALDDNVIGLDSASYVSDSGSNYTVCGKVLENVTLSYEKTKAGSDTKNAVQTLPEIAAESEIDTHFVGFTSTCRKNVALGQEALKLTKAAFDDDSKKTNEGYRDLKSNLVGSTSEKMVESIDQPLKQERHFGGFSTASGKKVKLSEQALKHARDTLDCDVSETDRQTLIGFSTASGKKVEFSEEALKHAKHALHNAVMETDQQSFIGFSTASGKRVELREQALTHAKQTLDCAVNEPAEKGLGNGQNNEGAKEKDPPLKAFTSTAVKNVELKEQALKHVIETQDTVVNKYQNEQTFSEVSTGLGNKVEISEQALKHAKSTIDIAVNETIVSVAIDKKMEFAEQVLNNTNYTLASAVYDPQNEQSFTGFSKASGKEVEFSEQALKHAKDKLDGVVEKTENEHNFIGFSTASGKKVEFSEQALKHAKDKLDSVVEKTENDHNFMGFSTASGKKVEFSEQALKLAKDKLDSVVEKTKTEHNFMGFSTASGKKVEFSEQALKHAKDKLDNVVDKAENENNFMAFSTASGKKVEFSEQALKLAKDKLDSVVEETKTERNLTSFNTALGKNVDFSEQALKHAKDKLDSVVEKTENEHNFIGFNTASGKKVEFSEQALKHAEDKLDSVVEKTENEHNFIGFSTASGKKVEFSEQALKHAKDKLDSVVEETKTERNLTSFSKASGKNVDFSEQALKHAKDKLDSVVEKTENEHNFMGFSTAWGKKVEFSEQALKHAKDKLDNVVEKAENEHNFMAFSTASGKKVEFSEQALKLAKDKLDSVVEETKTERNLTSFSTASGKNVDFSEQALKHAKDKLDSVVEKTENEHNFMGFSTASGKKVEFSEQALKHAKDKLDSVVEETKTEHNFMGFSTTSGKKVEFSEQALKHAKDKLDNVVEKAENEHNFMAFSTASGKKVEFSEQALKLAKDKLDSVVEETKNEHNFMGFSTALGKKVEFSEQALKLAKDKLDSALEETKTERNSMGFSTASGKKVGFSADSLEHAKVTLDSISKVTENEHTFMGFNSASGKKVGCSQKALEHAEQILKDNSRLEENQIIPPCLAAAGDEGRSTGKGMRMSIQTEKNPVMPGFSTAAGQNVDVSEKALKYIKTSVLQDQPGILDIKDIEVTDNSVDNKKSELSSCPAENSDDMDDMEEIFANALKRQKLDVNRERRLVQADSEESCTLKRKMAKTTCPDRNADKRHPGFRPFKPVFCKTISETKNNSSLRTISSTGVPDNPSFKTPYKAPVGTLNKQSTTHIPSLDGQKRSSNDARVTVSDLTKGDGPGTVRDSGPTASESDSLILSSHGDNGGYDAVVSSSCDGTNNQVKRGTDANADKAVKSGVKELEGNVRTETVATVLETTTGTVNDQQHEHITDNIVNCDGIVRNDSYDFDSFSQDEEDVYYCMLVEARHAQDVVIKQRSASRVQPVAGKLWNMKKTKGRWKLQDHIEKKYLRQKCSSYKEVTSRTAADYKFRMERHYGKDKANVTIGDRACLVPDDLGNIGKYEIYRAFLTAEGVDSKLITDTWVYNHYRWIVWKLAAYERFSSCPQSSCLTPTMVLLQLKYRYDREVDRAQRSSIKKIYERDDTPSKRLVLCVADVRHINIDESTGANSGHRTILELTDGWYSIPTQIDLPLTDLVQTGRICVGQKLCLSGADVVGGEDACTPLEAPASLMLKICRNSTRPATWDCKLGYQSDPRLIHQWKLCLAEDQAPASLMLKICRNSTRPATWDCKLGYQSDPRPLCVPLSGMCGDGGVVGIVDVVIVRKYPTLYMEKLEGGGCTFRTSKCEERARQEFETRKQVEMEKVYQLVESTAEKDNAKDKKVLRRKTFNRTTVEGFQTGREIYDALEEATRPDTVQNYLSERQMSMLYEYQRQVMEETHSEINSKFRNAWQEKSETFKERVVTPVLKFRVSGCANRDMDNKTSTILTIWRPSAEISDVQEGHRYKIYSVNTSMARSKYIGHTVQLTATKQTRYRRMQLDENILDNIYEAREVLLVSDVKRYQPIYGEMDFVGVIVKIMPSSQSNRAGDVVYLSDYQTGVLAVRFSNGFKSFGEDTFVVGNILCCCNLMDKSPYRNQSIPTVDATVEFTQISNKPLNANQRKAVDRLNSSYKDKKQFIDNALSAISELLGDKEPVPEYEKIKHLNEEFKDQFPNRKHLYDHSKISNSDTSLKSTPGNLKQEQSETSCSASILCVSVQDSNTSRSPGCAEISCDNTNIVNKADLEHSVVTSNVEKTEKTGVLGGVCGQLINTTASPGVNQSDSTPVTQRRRSIAQTKMSRLLSYGSPCVLSPLSLSVPRSVQRGFKPPAFKKL